MRENRIRDKKQIFLFVAGILTAFALVIGMALLVKHLEGLVKQNQEVAGRAEAGSMVELDEGTEGNINKADAVKTLLRMRIRRTLGVDPHTLAVMIRQPDQLPEVAKLAYSNYITVIAEQNPLMDAAVTIIREVKAGRVTFDALNDTPIQMEL